MGCAMAEMRIGQVAFFERGIDSIVGSPDVAQLQRLPDGHDDAPVAHVHLDALDTLFQVANLESLLDASVYPDAMQRELLSPRHFRAALDAAAMQLAALAAVRRPTQPLEAGLLDAGVRELAAAADLHDLLKMYRNALLQG